MRINPYNAITQIYSSNTRATGKKAAETSSYGRDEVEISSTGKEYQVAKKAVAEASDVRDDLVAEMKKKYSGNVSADIGDFADVLLSKYESIS